MTKAQRQQRLDKAALYEALRYKPHAGQLLVHRSKAPRRVLACGVRWGKTMCAAMEAVAALLQPRESTIGWTVAPTLELSERVFSRVVATFQTHFKSRIKEYSQREHRLVVVNFGGGLSELRGKSADSPESLLGEGLDFLIVDEAAKMKPEIWSEHLAQRLIDKRGWALLISTPSDRGSFWKEFRRGLKHRDAMYESWSSPSWTNPHLPRELIEAERKRLPPDTFKSQFAGEFLGFDLGPCQSCGCPDATLLSIYCGPDHAAESTCSDCEWPIDSHGRTTVMGFNERGEPRARMRLVFESRPGGTPPPTVFRNGREVPLGDAGPNTPVNLNGPPRPDGEVTVAV